MAANKQHCYHCGDECPDLKISIEEKYFCCEGCKTVYEILQENDLCQYYNLEENPGIKIKTPKMGNRFAYLDDGGVQKKIIRYKDEKQTLVQFYVPQIHCASCLWLLENLYKMRDGILNSRVDFVNKEVTIGYNEEQINLRQVVELLTSIGYEPSLSLEHLEGKKTKSVNRKLYIQLGVAGFAFGNIMLLSFPEYLGMKDAVDWTHSKFFGLISIILVLPVVLYSSQSYFTSAWHSLRKKYLNIDIPIALGIVVLFGWSVFEIASGWGGGYLDSLAGLVFFLLIGKWYQSKTYSRMSFERDYTSYFPIAVTRIEGKEETSVPLTDLKPGDLIRVRNQELIPADGILRSGIGRIDYSFVTGESKPVYKREGADVFAGGKQTGSAITLELTKKVSQSYLTQLWSQDAFSKKYDLDLEGIANRVSQLFTPVILILAIVTFLFWMFTGTWAVAVQAFVAVLIVACPCALALASPFTFGNALRMFGRSNFYFKDTHAIERLAAVDTIVFDKTGTITQSKHRNISFHGKPLSEQEETLVRCLVKQSTHPLSRELYDFFESPSICEIGNYNEVEGKGIEAMVGPYLVRLGSRSFIASDMKKVQQEEEFAPLQTQSWLSINGELRGYFSFENQYRTGLEEVFNELKKHYHLAIISGDNESERGKLEEMMGLGIDMRFNQLPQNKLAYIQHLQQKGYKVMMVGDGLNDAGALKQSDFGLTISEDVNNFSPACDAILEASRFHKLANYISYSKGAVNVVKAAFAISFLYNAVGLFFAMQGLLSPVIAAILMPVSSVTVVLFSTLTTWWLARRHDILMTNVTIHTDAGHNLPDEEGITLSKINAA